MSGKKRQKGKEATPESLLPMHRVAYTLGTSGGKPEVVRGKDAASHKHIMGVSGSGKSKESACLATQDINQRRGVCIIDPHGDLVDDILHILLDTGFYRDERAFSRVRYYDLARSDRFLPFNVLNQPYEPNRIGSAVWDAWDRAWGVGGGNAPMLEGFVKAGSFVLAQNREPITRLADLLTKADYRAQLLRRVHDPVILDHLARFEESGRRGSADVSSTLRRTFNLTYSSALRYTLGQRANALPFRSLMDQGISLLLNLGGLPPEDQRLLGCLLTVGIEEAALSRADVPEERRTGYHLIIDEWSQFSAQSSDALERILALTRKYGLSLTLAHQTWGQAEKLQSALQNACFIAFRLGRDDAHWAASKLADIDLKRTKLSPSGRPVYVGAGEQLLEWEQTLMSLPPRHAVMRLGQRTLRFQTLTVPQPRCTREQLEALKEEYARRYLTPRSEIERDMSYRGPSSSSSPDPRTPAPGSRIVVDEDPPRHRPAPQLPAPQLPSPQGSPPHGTTGTRRPRRQVPLDGDATR